MRVLPCTCTCVHVCMCACVRVCVFLSTLHAEEKCLDEQQKIILVRLQMRRCTQRPEIWRFSTIVLCLDQKDASCGLTGWSACRDCKRSSLWTSRTAYRSALIGSLFFTLRIFVRPLLFELSPPFHPCNIGISLPFHFCLIDFSRLLFGELGGGVLCHFLRCKIDSDVMKLST